MKTSIILFVAWVILFALNVWIDFDQRDKWRTEAVRHGCAEYNQTTGKWGWKTRNEK